MRGLRRGCCALALSLATLGAATASETPAGGDGPDCDVVCALQDYFARDHMVTLAPAPEARRPEPTAMRGALRHGERRTAAAATIEREKPAPRPSPPVRRIRTSASAGPTPSSRPPRAAATRTAQAEPTPMGSSGSAPDTAPRHAPAAIIPGGAPPIAAEFSPAR